MAVGITAVEVLVATAWKGGKSEEHNERGGGVNIVLYGSLLYIYTDSVKFVMPTYASA